VKRSVAPGHALPATRRRALAASAALLAASLAAGCGFKMRGSAELPFSTLYAGFAPTSAVGADFRRLIRASDGTQLVDRPEAAQARLDVLSELREKEIVSFSSSGRPREYQLRLRLTFRLVDAKGVELIPATELLIRREITTTDTQLVAKEQEEVIMYQEMQQDLVQQLLRRLAAVRV
jgi:LPS-assembly lipoprotein